MFACLEKLLISILLTNWRSLWATLSKLVFYEEVWDSSPKNLTEFENVKFEFHELVDQILSLHNELKWLRVQN